MSLLYLDPFIFFFVLLPISFVMFCLGILRHYATQLISSPSKPTLEMLKNMHLMKRATRLRTNAHVLTNEAWNARRSYLLKMLVKQDGKNNVENDPLAGLQQMKQQMLMIVPQMASMAWVSFFFSGFVLLKLPFGLTQRMKSMIQRGIVLKTLDASYVSSLSWYFLNMLGLSGIISLAIGAHGTFYYFCAYNM